MTRKREKKETHKRGKSEWEIQAREKGETIELIKSVQ